MAATWFGEPILQEQYLKISPPSSLEIPLYKPAAFV
jgi:hypothetical protein